MPHTSPQARASTASLGGRHDPGNADSPGAGVAAMIRRLLRFFHKPADPRDAVFARRAQRVCNRKREVAARFERVHAILARGPK